MTMNDEFRDILRVLLENPQPAGKRPPFAENGGTAEAVSNSVTSDKQSDGNCKGAV